LGQEFTGQVRRDRILLDQIGGRWMLPILGALCDSKGTARFNEIKRAVPGVSQKTLTQCLRQLERSGLLERHVDPGPPIKTQYSLTKLGFTLEKPILAVFQWTTKYSDAVRAAQKRHDLKIETAQEKRGQ